MPATAGAAADVPQKEPNQPDGPVVELLGRQRLELFAGGHEGERTGPVTSPPRTALTDTRARPYGPGMVASTGRSLALIVVCALALSGCSRRLDTPGLESALKTDIQRKADVSIRSVSCPDGLKPAKGATFLCTLTYGDRSKHHVTVTETDDHGDVRYEVTD